MLGVFSLPIVFADSSTQKTISKNAQVIINSNVYGTMTGQINECGESFQFSFMINPNTVHYDWVSVEEITCDSKQYKFHHVYLEVWEGKADNIHDTHEMHYSKHIKPVRESKDYSSLIDPFDKLGLRAAFIFTEN